ncbi:MAG TPA: helix-turn-helix transcriptional regulator [Vicinamibacterales bacterium]|nr:helix-turn-helix transcriptional regulator [Vicinamibacterales bacterium]
MKHFDLDEHLAEHLSSDSRRRRYAQNSVIVDVAVELNRALQRSGKSQKDFAERLGKSEGLVSQVLSGGGNLTLRTLGDFAWGLNCTVEISVLPMSEIIGSCKTETWNSPQIEPTKAANTQLALAA